MRQFDFYLHFLGSCFFCCAWWNFYGFFVSLLFFDFFLSFSNFSLLGIVFFLFFLFLQLHLNEFLSSLRHRSRLDLYLSLFSVFFWFFWHNLIRKKKKKLKRERSINYPRILFIKTIKKSYSTKKIKSHPVTSFQPSFTFRIPKIL